MTREFIWISKIVAEQVHDEHLRAHGGEPGYLNESRLEAALARPQMIAQYTPAASLEELAAAVAIGIAKGDPFNDGNKRTAAVVSLLFLRLNGVEISCSEKELGDVFSAVADGAFTEDQLALWLSENAS